jgi:hypothetical protein
MVPGGHRTIFYFRTTHNGDGGDENEAMKTREAAEMHMASVISLRISFQDVSS